MLVIYDNTVNGMNASIWLPADGDIDDESAK